jgi:hypothetical protein
LNKMSIAVLDCPNKKKRDWRYSKVYPHVPRIRDDPALLGEIHPVITGRLCYTGRG